MSYSYDWSLKDTNFTKDKGSVFSCFACGGGSTMGYKLAGFDVIGMNEIDPEMAECYIANHKPKYSYIEDIRTFLKRDDLPSELYSLDILDGSPPCSSFSMAGNREDDWGKEKKFREGQAEQVLDTLFFDFIALGKKLQPKVIVAENVKGILLGKAKSYVREIYKQLDEAGYYCQHWLLNASTMGVPQKRERVFFIALRKDLAKPFLFQKDMFTIVPKLDLKFSQKKILFGEIQNNKGKELSDFMKSIWEQRQVGDLDMSCTNSRVRNKPNTGFSQNYVYKDGLCNTLTAKEDCVVKFDYPRYLSDEERIKISTFPKDYSFLDNRVHYLVGMSVPPLMIANIAEQIYEQWLSKIAHT